MITCKEDKAIEFTRESIARFERIKRIRIEGGLALGSVDRFIDDRKAKLQDILTGGGRINGMYQL